jgi:hypothetical protein
MSTTTEEQYTQHTPMMQQRKTYDIIEVFMTYLKKLHEKLY